MKKDGCAAAARELARRLDGLGRITDTAGSLTRTFLSPAMGRANAVVGAWMREEGLAVREDELGNLIGRLEGVGSRAKTLLLGSHLDTVVDAGRFDGALGVLMPLAILAELRRRGVALPFAMEVVGFSEEEGVRFSSGYLGSKGYAGRLRPSDLSLTDNDGISVRQALEHHLGRSFAPPSRAHRRAELLGYVEVHIEQGPVLEAEDLAVGVVSAIAGQTRGTLTFHGRAGHAGTTPMRLRQDALSGAAEMILFAETLASCRPPLVATVGSLSVAPGVANVIPGEARFSLDVRHPRDAVRRAALRELMAQAAKIARRRGLKFSWHCTQENGAAACAPRLAGLLEKSVRRVQGRSATLCSGAGHDAVVMASIAPIAMLFVRCREGLSHHPREHAAAADLEVALRVMVDFIEGLAAVTGK